jgi:hypothetical protein
LIRAALSDGPDALDAWRRWSTEFDLDSLDTEGFWILPLLYTNLTKGDFQHPERRRLAGVYKQMRLRNALAQPRLRGLIERLQEAGADALPGPITSLVLLGLDDAIPLSPVQLLVPAEVLEVADALLQSLDWRPEMPLPPEPLTPFVACVRYRHHEAGDLRLCWRPFGPDGPPELDATCQQRSASHHIGKIAVRAAHPVDLLLMACRNNSLVQTSVLMKRLAPRTDWGAAESRSRELGLEREWRALVGTSPPELIHGVPAPVMQGQVDAKSRPRGDESVSLRRLADRHWKRFHRCTHRARPSSFVAYLAAYHEYAWQTTGTWQWIATAAGKPFRRGAPEPR